MSSPFYNTPEWTEYYAVWVDWNQNETFEDDENLIGLGIDNYVDIIAGGNATISFTVPVTALPAPPDCASFVRISLMYR